MSPRINLINLLILFGSVQGFNLSFFLLTGKSGHLRARRILSVLVLFISLDLFGTFLYLSFLIYHIPRMLGVSDLFYSFIGPLSYAYVLSLTERDFRFRLYHLIFLLPFLLEFVPLLRFNLLPLDERLRALHLWYTDSTAIRGYLMEWAFSALFHIGFLSAAVIRLIRHKKTIKDEYSDISEISLSGLRNILFIILLFLLIHLIMVIMLITDNPGSDFIIHAGYVITAIFFYIIGYKGLHQNRIYSSEDPGAQEKYSRSSLDDNKAHTYLGKLLNLMEEEKLYLRPELRSADVAGALKISTNHLSQIINDKLDRNFYDFINGYRVDEAKRLLSHPDAGERNLIDIAFDAGFSSKSSFNRVFKEISSMTPSQYRRSLG